MESNNRSTRRRIYWILGLGLLAVFGVGESLRYALQPIKTPSAASGGDGPLPTIVVKAPPNPAQLTYKPPKRASSSEVIQQMDAFYQKAAIRWVAYRFRGIASDGSISLGALRLATGIPPLPQSLRKAGIAVPSSLPAQGSVQGITPGIIQNLVTEEQSQHVSLSQSENILLLQTLGQVALAADSNNPFRFIAELDGVVLKGPQQNLDQWTVEPAGPFMSHITSVGAGILPNATHIYRGWSKISQNLTVQWNPAPTVPGQTVVAEATFQDPVQVAGIAAVKLGGAIGDVTMTPFSSVTLGLVRSGSQERWYVMDYQFNLAKPHVTKILANALNGQAQ